MTEPCHKKTCLLHMQEQRHRSAAQISCTITLQLISAFVFATKILQTLYILNAKFKASRRPGFTFHFLSNLVRNSADRFCCDATFLTPTLLFLYFLDNQTFKFKNTLEYVETRFPGNTCQFS